MQKNEAKLLKANGERMMFEDFDQDYLGQQVFDAFKFIDPYNLPKHFNHILQDCLLYGKKYNPVLTIEAASILVDLQLFFVSLFDKELWTKAANSRIVDGAFSKHDLSWNFSSSFFLYELTEFSDNCKKAADMFLQVIVAEQWEDDEFVIFLATGARYLKSLHTITENCLKHHPVERIVKAA